MKRVDETPLPHIHETIGLQHPILVNLEAYWRMLAKARQVPERNHIHPEQIDGALPHTFILQRVAPGIARLRVAGQQLHDLLKMDARGMPLSAFFLPHAHEPLAKIIETAFSEPAIFALPLLAPGNLIRAHLSGTMLLLPLRDSEGQTTRMLGAIVTQGERGTRPRRFEIANVPIRYESLGIKLATTQATPQPRNAKGPDVARPALRLVVDNG